MSFEETIKHKLVFVTLIDWAGKRKVYITIDNLPAKHNIHVLKTCAEGHYHDSLSASNEWKNYMEGMLPSNLQHLREVTPPSSERDTKVYHLLIQFRKVWEQNGHKQQRNDKHCQKSDQISSGRLARRFGGSYIAIISDNSSIRTISFSVFILNKRDGGMMGILRRESVDHFAAWHL